VLMKVAGCTGEGTSAVWSAQPILWPLVMIYIGALSMHAVFYPILTERLLASQEGHSPMDWLVCWLVIHLVGI
jgi:hypothetical protein